MNRNLKRIAHKAGLTSVENWVDAHGEHQESRLCEIISSHYGRYTFIYTGLTKLGMTPDELARFTGHADSTMINEVYSVLTKEDKAAMACRTLQRIIPQPEAGRGKREREVIGELKNILVFLGANYEDVCDIDDEDQLCRLLYGEYEHKLMEKGVECGTLKEIYNTKGMTLKQRKELLVKTVKTLQEEINALTQ